MGAVLGRTSHIQLIVMGIMEITAYALNSFINDRYFKVNLRNFFKSTLKIILQAIDAGGSILIHAFGAYFGLAVSYVIGRRQDSIETAQESCYVSNILAMIGKSVPYK